MQALPCSLMDVGAERQMMLRNGGGGGGGLAQACRYLCAAETRGGREGGRLTAGPCSGPFIPSKPPRVHCRCCDVLIWCQRTQRGSLTLLVQNLRNPLVFELLAAVWSRVWPNFKFVVSVWRIIHSENANVVSSDLWLEDDGALFSQAGKITKRGYWFEIKPRRYHAERINKSCLGTHTIKTGGSSQRGTNCGIASGHVDKCIYTFCIYHERGKNKYNWTVIRQGCTDH